MNLLIRHLPKIIFVLAVLFIVAGIVMGEPVKVFDQAIRICLGCIGIG